MSGFCFGLGWVALALLTAGSAPAGEAASGLVLKRVMLSTGGSADLD